MNARSAHSWVITDRADISLFGGFQGNGKVIGGGSLFSGNSGNSALAAFDVSFFVFCGFFRVFFGCFGVWFLACTAVAAKDIRSQRR